MTLRFIYRIICLVVMLYSGVTIGKEQQAKLIFAAEMRLIDNKLHGDYPELAGLLKEVRNSNQPTFFFFGGGSLGPSPMSAFDRGSHIIDILNTLEPDAMSASKREFSYFEEELSLRSYEAAFPIIASNLTKFSTGRNLDGLVDHLLIEKGGIKLGVISILEPTIVKEYLLTSVHIADPKQAIIDKSQEMRELGADFVVLLPSFNFPYINELLEQGIVDLSMMADPHFNLISDGVAAYHPNNVFITEAGVAAELTLTWDDESKDNLLVDVSHRVLKEQPVAPKAQMQVADYSQRLDRLLGGQVGILTTKMDTRRKVVRSEESAFANFVADSLRAFFHTDLAMINGGVIRGEQMYKPKTTLTRRDIAKELPFRSRIVVIEIKGREIKAALENGLSMIEASKGRFLHLSGARAIFDSNAKPGERLKELLIGGQQVNDDKTYTIATSDYLASGGDDFTMLKEAKVVELNTKVSPLLSEVVINHIRQLREIAPKVEGRLIDLAKGDE